MKTVKYNRVNPLVNPVSMDDVVISESGERYIVRQNMRGEYWLSHTSGSDITRPVSGQIAICNQIDQLINL